MKGARAATLPPLAVALAAVSGCAQPGVVAPAAVTFDTATVWLREGADSTRLVVEVAASRAQHEVGLAGRTSLAPDSGMLFLFDPPRSADEGFWMWQTPIPLDIAFIDASGAILRILGMDPCVAPSQDDCPGYFAEAPYAAALEVSRGWFARNGIGVGASVRVD